jgi:molybdopterin molybdotransferase
VRDAGGEPLDLGIASDSQASIKAKLEQARDADLVITSAGISVGDHDYVRSAFDELGGALDFWKVRMRPGAPLAFGMLGETPWIGLSGNPVSAIVTFEIFVRPAVRKMLGLRSLFRETIPVRVSHPITLAAPLMHFLRVIVERSAPGEYEAKLAGSQSSGVLTAMARSNALLVLPGDKLKIAEGEIHRALPLSGDFSASDTLVLA